MQAVVNKTSIKPRFSLPSNFEGRINTMWHSEIIVYDSVARIAWMVPKLHLLIYMVRCYLEKNDYKNRELLIHLDHAPGLNDLRSQLFEEATRWQTEYKGLPLQEQFGTLCQALQEVYQECSG